MITKRILRNILFSLELCFFITFMMLIVNSLLKVHIGMKYYVFFYVISSFGLSVSLFFIKLEYILHGKKQKNNKKIVKYKKNNYKNEKII
ncbi:hypothetical protein Q3304_08235 [Clostridioides sp. GD02377]|uniref:hypothetical protein n=1 Tax=Clostridioides sp. GD02377 TaxID=3054353 RepID=UPI0038A2BA0D